MGTGTGGIPTTDNIPETTEKIGCPTDNIPETTKKLGCLTDNIPETTEIFGCPTDNIPGNRFFKRLILLYSKCRNNRNFISIYFKQSFNQNVLFF